jgi:4-oxalomesaconate hydratase
MTDPTRPQRALVVSAHAADFVWRAGGAIASTVAAGGQAHVVCLTFGERGESQGLWAVPGMTLAEVKSRRLDEATRAAALLGATIEFWDSGDYPLLTTEPMIDALVQVMREQQPDVILTHPRDDPYNLDHSATFEFTMRSRMVAQAQGHSRSTTPIGAPQVLQFEPHQPEQCGFVPDLLLDISPVFAQKLEAMEVMGAQGHLVDYYADLAVRRGVQARRNGGAGGIVHAEAFERVFPVVSGHLL